MKPNISIIVPVYNVEKYINECIDSLLSQTFTNYELILVNDGSTDNSGNICDEYSLMDNRIKVLHKYNGGLSSARNAGLEIARGDYIGFVDSDDWIDPDMYKVLYYRAIQYSADLSVCNINSMKKDKRMESYAKNVTDKVFSKQEAMRELPNNEIITFSACNKLFKRNLFENLRYVEGIILEDMDLTYKLINKANKVVYSSKCLYNYRYNNSSILRSSFTMKKIDEYYVRKKMYKFYVENYQESANLVYLGVHSIGVELYTNISLYKKEKLQDYKFLLESDKNILTKLIKDKNINIKERIKIIFFLISPISYVLTKKIVKKVRK